VAVAVPLIVWTAVLSLSGNQTANPLVLAGLAGAAVLLVTGAVRRWPWLLRLCVALNGVMLLVAATPGSHMWLPALLSTALLAVLLVVRYFRGARRPAVAAS
jgi:hypothetical protein